ncbi:MAG: hypothetical protein CM1200mP40_03530 [Gammaproteobacteria bacterium]|nr:MAG: hypothetical protein CM1200mP40_03530 [Gammaproteobacteria bacterium]
MVWRGEVKQLMMWANRNGYFYVLDRTNGEFLEGKPYVRVNWSRVWMKMADRFRRRNQKECRLIQAIRVGLIGTHLLIILILACSILVPGKTTPLYTEQKNQNTCRARRFWEEDSLFSTVTRSTYYWNWAH